jgi:hypothetical protein
MVAHELMPAFGRARHRQPMGLRAHRSLALPASCIHAPVEHRSAGSEQRQQRRPRSCGDLGRLDPGQGERTGLPQRALSERCFLALPLPCDRGRCCGWPHLLHHLRRPVPLLAVGSSSGTAPPCPQSCSRNGRLGRLLVGSAGTGSPTSWHPQRSAPSLSWCERRGLARGVGWPPSGLAWWRRSGWRPWPRRTQSLDPGALSGWRSRACSHYEIRPGGAPWWGLEAMRAPPGHRCDQTSLPARPQGATCTGQPATFSRYTAVTLNKAPCLNKPSSRHEDATPPDSPAIRSGPETSWRVYIYSKQCFLLYLTKVVFHSTAEDYFSIGLGLIGNLRFVGGLLFSLISLAYFTSIFVVVSRELRVYRTGTGRAVTLPTMARNFIYALDASVCERKQRQAFERE